MWKPGSPYDKQMAHNSFSPHTSNAREMRNRTEESSSEDPLEVLARQLSGQFRLAEHTTGKLLLLDRLQQHEKLISDAYQQFSIDAQTALPLSYAGEWLLDNFFVVQQAIRQVREDLPPGYYRELPKLKDSDWTNLPRNYAIANEIIGYSSYQLDIEQIVRFLQTFQTDTPLTMGELWAFPTMLRLGILSGLANSLGGLAPYLESTTVAVTSDSAVQFCITSLRLLSVQDWEVFFERVSLVDQILRQDPANVYTAMDFDTRNSYREVVEQLARLTKQVEDDVTKQAIKFSQKANPSSPQRHVGYYLIGEGRRQLEDWFQYHPSGWLRLRRWLLTHPTPTYLASIGLLSVLFMLVFTYVAVSTDTNILQIFGVGLLTFLPATAIATGIVNWAVTNSVSPYVLPRMDFQEGIPARFQTMVVIPTLLNDTAEIDSLLQQLEMHFLRNADSALFFALLTDYADAPYQHMPHDEDLISRAQIGISALNAKYRPGAPPFYLFHRERQWNAAQSSWMGWERKRGKLVEFNHLLRNSERTSYTVQVGDLSILPHIKYVITLDADTILPEGSARRLIGALAHPLNRAKYDPDSGKVVSGYSILQPRIEIKPTSANQTRFTHIFAGDIGLDLYTNAVSDVYQDLFGEGSYVGKGIYDVDVLEACLARRIPENALLSHDLFEGIHARVALASDIVLLEEYPTRYLAYTRRLHRWIRGDWQLLPWLLPRVPTDQAGQKLQNTFSTLDRWKIFDNLRRSLVAPATLALLFVAWLGLIDSPLFWTLTTLMIAGFPLFMTVLTGLRRPRPAESMGNALRSKRLEALRWLFAVIFLPYEAFITLNAITTTLVRLFITRKRMLQWTTAAQTAQSFWSGRGSASTWHEMMQVPLFTGVLTLLIVMFSPTTLPFAVPILVLWLVSPQVAYWISLPVIRAEPELSVDQEVALRHLARQTWLFFEQTVGPEDHWLPPDHFQEVPHTVAHRTSPTNIGLLLTSTLAAYDLGYIGSLDLVTRWQATFDTLDRLEHYRGHLLNWYDTKSLASLVPRYVSTVDSGNLAGCLIVIEQACLTFNDSLVFHPQRWQGLLDTLGLLNERLEALYNDSEDVTVVHLRTYIVSLGQTIQVILQFPDQWASLISWLSQEAWETLSDLIFAVLESEASSPNAETLNALRVTSERFHHHLTNMQRDIDLLLPWLLPVSQPPALFVQTDADPRLVAAWQDLLAAIPASPRLGALAAICETLASRLSSLQAYLPESGGSATHLQESHIWCARLAERLNATQIQVNTLLAGYQELASRAETRFQAMDFAFLFNAERKVFHIGYNVTNDKPDDNFYDLLASEARLASFLAIAKREVPPVHWLHLGRPVTRVHDTLTLLSWSGTMFEYLMPTLFLKSYEQTFLTQSCRSAVDDQIRYGQSKNVPWGISESSYYAFDSNTTYQYRAFGVPELGFKRDLAEDLVITPYASLLALRLRPQAVRQNMDQLDAIKMRGLYGFYEAVDYTPSRVPLRQDHAIVRSYMAHHQGMILSSLTNYLLNDLMIQRFHADPRVQSFSLLLQEKNPTQVPIEVPDPIEVVARAMPAAQVSIAPWQVPYDTTVPHVHILSNGSFSTVITNAGSGYSQWHGLSLTRWEADTTLDASGFWIYLQDQESGDLWSAGYQPMAVSSDYQHVLFYPHQAEFQHRNHDITVNMQVTIAADDDVEIRQLNLINHSNQPRHLRVTSYGEVLLAAQSERHPAFNKLFIESEYLPETNMILFHRRLRADEEPVYLGHLLITSPGIPITGAYEGGRLHFLGRGHSLRSPIVFGSGGSLSQTVGVTLDPIMALAQDAELEPYGRISIAYLTFATRSRQEALALAYRYRDWAVLERVVELARRQNELALRQLDLDTPELARLQQVLALLLYPHAGLRASADVISANTDGQSGLWRYGISGDVPILLVRVSKATELPLVLEILRAHAYWREQQVSIDLVILNLQDSSYSQELQEQLHRLIARSHSSIWLNRHGGIFVVNAAQMKQSDQTVIATAARVILDGQRGSVAEHLLHLPAHRASLPFLTASLSNMDELEATPPLPRPTDLQFDNGWGGFSADGKEYVIYLEAAKWTPAPWVNVIANEQFGFLVSESGAGYTWAENSSENRLTPWRNDPIGDSPGEALYIRDEETAQVWSPMPLPSRDSEPYLVRHGAGYSLFEHHSQGLKQKTLLFAAMDAPVKIIKLCLENTWNRPRRVSVTYYAEWVLGVSRGISQAFIVPEYDHNSGALLAHNSYNTEFGERVAFLAANKAPHGLTTDRTEFLGRMGDLRCPAALRRIGLASTVEAGLDPCAAIQLHVDLPVGGSEEVYFLLGQGSNREHASQLIQDYQDPVRVEAARQAVTEFWDRILGTVSVQTPDPAMNMMLNRWLLYQALSCRIWGRSGFYQSSGAFGFRDQLQDVMALIWAAPAITRDHILCAAQHQFEAGDVLHWWHPPTGRGVKTRCSDDMLWLPFVVAHYVETTGDEAILDESIPFLRGDPLKLGEEERYGQYDPTAETYSLYEHCLRAIRRGSTAGVHGLPLMGTGDWNDGMNRVGIQGSGESVWLGWFLYSVLKRFAPLCQQREDTEQASAYAYHADHLKAALETESWDGQWYRRAYYDNGTPLGSAQSLECRIDSIAQSWAVLSNAGDPFRALNAMSAVAEYLIRSEDQLLLLFTPPFDQTANDPGYVKSYPPGIRENGGQYTHAAVWAVWAFAELGQGNRAGELFRLLNPISASDTPRKTEKYRVEPYVVAADVYSVAPHNGRGGWTWYTGSASWMYRLGIEAILGFKRKGNRLEIAPCIPDDWPGYELTYREGETIYSIHVHNPQGVNRGAAQITFDGNIVSGSHIILENDGRRHDVHVELRG
jgi:cyclic beta-1,2-glucan synthetase